MRQSEKADFADRIVDTAVALAERSSWESVRLHQVALSMGVGLDEIRRCFAEKDELIDRWFDRADDAMLRLADSGGLVPLSPRKRLFELIMAWLDALEDHRRMTRQMIQAKLEPGHLHIQVPALMRVSRTVQWMREAARLKDAGLRRALTETAATGIYLAAFASWMSEDKPGSPRTRRRLERLLRGAEQLAQVLPFFADDRNKHRDSVVGVKKSATHSKEAGQRPAWTP